MLPMDSLPVYPVEPSKVTPENMLISITISKKQSMEVVDWLIQNGIAFSCFQKQSKEEAHILKSGANTLDTANRTYTSPKEKEISAVIQTIHEQITGHISAEIPSVGDITTAFNINPIKFKAVFKKMYQMPFHQYFIKHKMEQARQLLESGKFSVKQISEMLGYTTSVKFVVVFKKYQNVTPGVLKTWAKARETHKGA